MELGHFSISLAVEDLARSRAFYEALGFTRLDGDGERWLVLQNGAAKIGLFQKMFEDNLVTFNPPDVRRVEAELRAKGYAPERPTEGSSGPTSAVFRDPDGNVVLLDQHAEGPQAAPPERGAVKWVDLTAEQAPELAAFYAAVLGLTSEGVDMGGYEDFMLRASPDAEPVAGVCHARGPNESQPAGWMAYFLVDELEPALARALERGGTAVREPVDAGSYGRYVVIRDPAGNTCALFQKP